jgi:hypothetical protein
VLRESLLEALAHGEGERDLAALGETARRRAALPRPDGAG